MAAQMLGENSSSISYWPILITRERYLVFFEGVEQLIVVVLIGADRL